MIKLLVFLVVIMVAKIAFSATKHDLGPFERSLNANRKEISSLESRLKGQEERIAQINKRYQESLETSKKLQETLNSFTAELTKESENISDMKLKVQTLQGQLLMIFLGEEEEEHDEGFVLVKTRLLTMTKEQTQLLVSAKEKLQLIQNTIDLFKKRVQEESQKEQNLVSLINKLESERSGIATLYLQKKDGAKEDALKIEQQKLALKASVKNESAVEDLGTKFSLPIKEYTSIKSDGKMIAFDFVKESKIFATADGVIKYANSLSTYGKVVIIDHGNEIRTVLHGQFEPSVVVGKKVLRGELIGQAVVKAGVQGRVFFGVRKKNLVMSALNSLEKNALNPTL